MCFNLNNYNAASVKNVLALIFHGSFIFAKYLNPL